MGKDKSYSYWGFREVAKMGHKKESMEDRSENGIGVTYRTLTGEEVEKVPKCGRQIGFWYRFHPRAFDGTCVG